jgi:hypothetical protein
VEGGGEGFELVDEVGGERHGCGCGWEEGRRKRRMVK